VALPLTPPQTVGPFFHYALVEDAQSELVPAGEPGAVKLHGVVTDGAGDPVPDAMVEIWHPGVGFGRAGTAADGSYAFVIVKPAPRTLQGGRAPHLEFAVFGRGLLRQSVTCVYFPDETRANAEDPLLHCLPEPEVRARLVARPDAEGLRFDIRLQGDDQTPFFDTRGEP
jgi:protocatechuate 3,4-dioxygenase alpha subunit